VTGRAVWWRKGGLTGALAIGLLLAACGGAAPASSPAIPSSGSTAPKPATSSVGESAKPAASAKPAGSASAAAKPVASFSPAPASDQFITGNPYLPKAGEAPVNVKAAWCAVSAGFSQLFVARDYGLFSKYGLNVSSQLISGTQTFMSALQSGEIDFLYCASTGVAPALASGVDATMVAAPLVGLPYVLVARKGINSVQDLKGKKLGISQQGDLDDRLFQGVLKQQNVPIDSVQRVPAGGQTERYKAVLAGNLDAINVTPPLEVQAQNDGLNVIYHYKDLNIPNFSPILAGSKVLKAQPRAVQRFVATMAESLWYMDSHKPQVEASVGKQLGITDPAALDSAYQAYAKDYVNLSVAVPIAAVQDGIDYARTQGTEIKRPNPADMVDQRFAQDLQTSGFLEKMWGRPILPTK